MFLSHSDEVRPETTGSIQADANETARSARFEVWSLERRIKRARAIAKTAEGLANLIRFYPDSVRPETTVAELLALASEPV
jgi:hypothetical protein